MSDNLFTQIDFARKLSEDLGKTISKQNVGYYKSTGKLTMISGFVIKDPGNTSFSKGDAVSKKDFEAENIRVEQDGGNPAEGKSTPLVDYEKSCKSLLKKLDPSRQKNFSPGSDNSDDSQAGSHSSKPGEFDYNKSKARNEHYKSEMSKMECLRIAGKLTDTEEVEDDSYTTAAQTRDSILDVPFYVSATLAAMTDPDEIENFLTDELNKALKSLSDKFKEEISA